MLQSDTFAPAGLLANLVSLPLDYTKTHIQVHNTLPKPSIFLRYIGLEVVLFKYLIFYNLRQCFQKLIPEDNKSLLLFSSSLSYFLLTPFDHILVKLQTKNLQTNKLSNIMNTSIFIVKKYGISGFFLGGLPNTLKCCAFGAASMNFDTTLYPYHVILWKYFLIMATMIPAVVFSHPFDVVKTHMQKNVLNVDGNQKDFEMNKIGREAGREYTRFSECCVDLYKKYGMKVFYRGIYHAYARAIFIVAAPVTAFEIYHPY
ncbi:hypothetical protein SteCoe_21572 [Stentor coeruleus]|uniref:ADP,ATP carrier protein n=1 Tax=Stentor coeruleus TaxID=5963 RepID=A0A1R2BP66_9CILI|nr:hypothetical protein SteCoe_21572 [Stentor coeruleus]